MVRGGDGGKQRAGLGRRRLDGPSVQCGGKGAWQRVNRQVHDVSRFCGRGEGERDEIPKITEVKFYAKVIVRKLRN